MKRSLVFSSFSAFFLFAVCGYCENICYNDGATLVCENTSSYTHVKIGKSADTGESDLLIVCNYNGSTWTRMGWHTTANMSRFIFIGTYQSEWIGLTIGTSSHGTGCNFEAFDEFSNLSTEIYAGSGDDTVYGSNLDDYIEGEDGEDDIWGNEGDDEILGGPDSDHLRGNAGEDTIYGNDGDDILEGGVMIDCLYGGDGGGPEEDDQCDGGLPNDEDYCECPEEFTTNCENTTGCSISR